MSPANSPLGTLYIYDVYSPGAHRGLRILATAALAGKEIAIDRDYKHFETNRTPEFRAKFPTGQVPAFETAEGEFISEGSAIAWYIAASAREKGLLGKTAAQEAQVAQWQGFVDFAILNNLIFVYGQLREKVAPRELIQAKLDTAITALEKLDTFLKNKSANNHPAVLVGEVVTLADIAVVSGLVRGYQGVFDKKIQDKFPTVFEYTKRILAIPEVAKAYRDEVKFAEVSPFDSA